MTYRILAILLLLVNTLTLHSQLEQSMRNRSQTDTISGFTIAGRFNTIRDKFGEMGFKDVFKHVVNEQIEDIFGKYVVEIKDENDSIHRIDDYAKIINHGLKRMNVTFVMNGNLYVLTYKPRELGPGAYCRDGGIMGRDLYLYGLDETGEWFEATDSIKTDERKGQSYMSAFFPFQFNDSPNQPYSYVKKLEEENIVIMYILYHEFDGKNYANIRPYYKIITLIPKNNREFTFKKETDWDVKKYINKE